MLEPGSINIPLTFDVVLYNSVSYKSVHLIHATFQSNCAEGLHFSAFSFSIRLLGFFKCSWWHPRQANDAAASERNILGKNHNCNFFSALHESVGTYILFWDLHAQGGKKLRRNIHTHNNYHNPCCTCVPRVN